MSYASQRFIDPHALAAIADLELVARSVVDGFMFGVHASRVAGSGMEFSQYRSYQPGDDVRHIDWRLFARSDRYYVREADQETSLTVRFVLDASESMAHDDDGIAKFDYARFLVASLAHLAHGQGDEIALHALAQGDTRTLRAGRDRQALHRMLYALEGLEPGGAWPPWASVEGVFAAAPHRELVVAVTDLHEHAQEITTALAKLAALRNEVVLLHLVAGNECTFAYRGAVRFEELETGRVIEVDADRVREEYLVEHERHARAIRRRLQNDGVSYTMLRTDRPLDQGLRAFLTLRMQAV